MSKLEVKFALLKDPLFFEGVNWGQRLDPQKSSKHAEMQLYYDRAEKELHVVYGNETMIIPSSSFIGVVLGKVTTKAPHLTHPIVSGINKAQVESPMAHVHEGLGKGKTK